MPLKNDRTCGFYRLAVKRDGYEYACVIRLDQLTSKEIANILNISGEGIKKARYRLRKKLGLESSDSLEELILGIA